MSGGGAWDPTKKPEQKQKQFRAAPWQRTPRTKLLARIRGLNNEIMRLQNALIRGERAHGVDVQLEASELLRNRDNLIAELNALKK